MKRQAGALLTIAALALCGPAHGDEKSAGAAVGKLGGLIKRDETLAEKPVIEVSFQGSKTGRKIKDADLAILKDLKHLKTLYLGYVTDTSDAGLVYLKGLKSLETLALPDTHITDKGLENLRGLTNLKSLALVFCKGITDKGLMRLTVLKNLKSLNVADTKVTDKGTAAFQKAVPGVYIIH